MIAVKSKSKRCESRKSDKESLAVLKDFKEAILLLLYKHDRIIPIPQLIILYIGLKSGEYYKTYENETAKPKYRKL